MKRYIKSDSSFGQEILRIRDELDSGKSFSTTYNKEIADMYKNSPKKAFQVKDNGDGSYSISLKSSIKSSKQLSKVTSQDELDDEWSPYHGHKYRINGGDTTKYADTPVKALQIWFQLAKNNPMDTAIMTPKKAYAVELCQAATPEVIERMYDKYGSCYKLDYLIDEAAKKATDGCKFFYEDKYGYGDQIHPFCYG